MRRGGTSLADSYHAARLGHALTDEVTTRRRTRGDRVSRDILQTQRGGATRDTVPGMHGRRPTTVVIIVGGFRE